MSGKLRAYLVDDELPALKRLSRMLADTGRVDVVGSTTNPEQALRFLATEEPDVLFLDIQMPVLNGFDLLSRLDRQPVVIFVTAYDQYALQAFQVNSIDYLLKPVEPEQLERALTKLALLRGGQQPPFQERPEFRALIQELSRAISSPQPKFPERMPVRIGERTQFLDIARITHFFSEDRLTYAATEARKYCVDWPIAELEQKLDPAVFVRIHRAVLLNLHWVEELTPLFAGRLVVRLKDQKRTELTVARDRARSLKTHLGL
ncbi:Response regulator receiver protein [Candidatus Sulfopaludibacter sp. SbA3]|nr:Response regulator receiver protein [Candidatus Sulfopaludibacter sp. SbA3]